MLYLTIIVLSYQLHVLFSHRMLFVRILNQSAQTETLAAVERKVGNMSVAQHQRLFAARTRRVVVHKDSHATSPPGPAPRMTTPIP